MVQASFSVQVLAASFLLAVMLSLAWLIVWLRQPSAVPVFFKQKQAMLFGSVLAGFGCFWLVMTTGWLCLVLKRKDPADPFLAAGCSMAFAFFCVEVLSGRPLTALAFPVLLCALACLFFLRQDVGWLIRLLCAGAFAVLSATWMVPMPDWIRSVWLVLWGITAAGLAGFGWNDQKGSDALLALAALSSAGFCCFLFWLNNEWLWQVMLVQMSGFTDRKRRWLVLLLFLCAIVPVFSDAV